MSVELLVADIQQRFGYQTLRRAAELVSFRETLSTGIAAADELLEGGLLRGATHGISGQPTSGATSLLYAAVASAQGQALPVVYLDMGGLVDPPNAAAAGIEIERLLLLSRTSLKHALFLLRTLALQQLPCLVVIDQPRVLPLAQLKVILRDAPLTLLALSPQPLPQMQVALASLQHNEWIVPTLAALLIAGVVASYLAKDSKASDFPSRAGKLLGDLLPENSAETRD